MKPKFEFGDIVECTFTGVIECGVVTVRKRLFVQGVSGYVTTNKLYFTYNVVENDPAQYSENGRVYQKEESELMQLEPVVQETERANRKFVAPAVNQVDRFEANKMQAIQKAFDDAKNANQFYNPWAGTTTGIGSGIAPNDYHALSNAAKVY